MTPIDALQEALRKVKVDIADQINVRQSLQSRMDESDVKLFNLKSDETALVATLDLLQGASLNAEASLAVARGKDG